MTISTLKIRNFQSHKNTQIKFFKGINLICGKTDSGKSSIRRALEWATKNKPSGNSFRSNWGGDTYVELSFKNASIKRIKGNNRNEYQLNGSKYKAFGQNIPDNISKLINIGAVNIQRQFDPVFLFSKSPGEVAKHLNETVDINIIDKAQANISRVIKKEAREIERQKQDKASLKAELNSFKWITEAEKQIAIVEKLEKEIQEIKEKILSIQKTLNEIETIKTKEKEIAKTLKFKVEVRELINSWKKIKEEREILDIAENNLRQMFIFIQNKKCIEDNLQKNSEFLKISLKNNCPLCGRN